MSTNKQGFSPSSPALLSAWEDFITSRQAILCTAGSVRFYRFTAGRFLHWLDGQGVSEPGDVTPAHVRSYLAERSEQVRDSTLHGHARAVRTLLLFWHAEGLVPRVIKVRMPRVASKQLPFLTAEELRSVVDSCETVRDRALVMLLADTGVRASELLALRWDDVDHDGTVRVRRGKGGKSRVVFCGGTTVEALEGLKRLSDSQRLFPLTVPGLRGVLLRAGKRANLHLSAHMLRRTFATLSIKAGMPLPVLSALLGHASVTTTQLYLRLVQDDLQAAQQRYGVVDHLLTAVGA